MKIVQFNTYTADWATRCSRVRRRCAVLDRKTARWKIHYTISISSRFFHAVSGAGPNSGEFFERNASQDHLTDTSETKKSVEITVISNRNSGFASFSLNVFECVSGYVTNAVCQSCWHLKRNWIHSRARINSYVIMSADNFDSRRSRTQASARTLAPALSCRLIVLGLNC